jgi:hypothetical protein
MWLFQAYRAHEIAAERRREADHHRFAASLPRSHGPGPLRRGLARTFAASSRSIAAAARRLDAASLDGPALERRQLDEGRA